jgi:hypothetical protein
MRLKLISTVAFVAVMTVGTPVEAQKNEYGAATPDAIDVSLVELIANGTRFDGKIVRVDGVIHLEFEASALYLSKEHWRHRVTKNSIWITPDYARLRASSKELAKFNGRYAVVEGRFNSKNGGHFGMFSGAIENVTRVRPWAD